MKTTEEEDDKDDIDDEDDDEVDDDGVSAIDPGSWRTGDPFVCGDGVSELNTHTHTH